MNLLCQSGSEVSEPTPRVCVMADRSHAVIAVWRPFASVRPMQEVDMGIKMAATRPPSSLTLTRLALSLSRLRRA